MDTVQSIQTYCLKIPRDVPYLGALGDITPNEKGYFVRPRNKTVYSVNDHSMVVQITTRDGVVGWGEALAPVSPQVSATVVNDLLGPLVIGRNPQDVIAIHEDLFDTMKVRGCSDGFFSDALAALDIALWDIKGKQLGMPVASLLGGKRRDKIPAYVSGLPKPTAKERADLACEWIARGFDAVKFASVVSYDGDVAETRALRGALGDGPKIMADLHWRYDAVEAVGIIRRMNEYGLALAEAPVHPHDIDGQAYVTQMCGTSVGIGEELRHVYAFRDRFARRCMNVAQPEMGRLGISEFWNVCQMARAHHCPVMPHASIGVGIFQAASLQAAAAVQDLPYHEYQHSVFSTALRYLDSDMACENGYFTLPTGAGLGVTPRQELFRFVM